MSNIVEKIESSVKDAVGVVETEAAKAVTAVEPVIAKAEAGIAKAEADAAATLAAARSHAAGRSAGCPCRPRQLIPPNCRRPIGEDTLTRRNNVMRVRLPPAVLTLRQSTNRRDDAVRFLMERPTHPKPAQIVYGKDDPMFTRTWRIIAWPIGDRNATRSTSPAAVNGVDGQGSATCI